MGGGAGGRGASAGGGGGRGASAGGGGGRGASAGGGGGRGAGAGAGGRGAVGGRGASGVLNLSSMDAALPRGNKRSEIKHRRDWKSSIDAYNNL